MQVSEMTNKNVFFFIFSFACTNFAYALTITRNTQRMGNDSQTTENTKTIIIQQRPSGNGLGTAGFVLSLIAFLISWIPIVSGILWFLGLIFSFIGLFRSPRGLAIAGFVISFIWIIVVCIIGATLAVYF